MASKTSTTRARKPAARSFDVLLPRLNRAAEGVTFESGNYVRRTGTVPAVLTAVRLTGSPLGVHAAPKDGGASLCGVSVTPNGKATADVQASGQAAKVAPHVTCKFCQARLVGAGVLAPDAPNVGAYAADYGSRDAAAELQAIEDRAST